MTLQKLVATLSAVDKPTKLFETEDGTRILILPYGGRILGVFSPDSAENFLWTNSALDSPETARVFYSSGDWQNSGGDRTWLAPELDFFFPKFPNIDISGYWQPRELDPGNYEVMATVHGIRLTNRLTIQGFRSRKKVHLEITKVVTAAANPLRHSGDSNLGPVEYAGHTLETSLEILGTSPSEAPLVGLWSLTQMPHEGELFIATFSKTEPRIYFGLTNGRSENPSITDRMVRFSMKGAGEHKIGIRAAVSTGRMGYLYPTGSKLALIVRNYFVNPSGEYADVPWNDPEDRGYSTQACSVSSKWGMFSEMEYHVPGIGADTGLGRVVDRSHLWAFRGAHEDIREIARSLLSSEIP